VANTAEVQAMLRAVELAALGLGATSPNPVVGAVVLDSVGAIAGYGFHRRAGDPHAEMVALEVAGIRARGGTCVVTLEPCNHTGRTGPCVAALREAGVARVVYAVDDPTPAAGGGAAALRAAGVAVEGGVLKHEAELVNEVWLTSVRFGRPFVTWKYAASLDGRTAAVDGSSRWITSEAARADAHRLRAEADAVLVGSGTVLADNPQLAVRKAGLPSRQPLRVVLDARVRVQPTARVLDAAAPTLLLVAADQSDGPAAERLRSAGAEVVGVPTAVGGGLDVAAVLAELHRRQILSLLVEGGAQVAGSFLAAGLIDRVVGYLAPMLIGGDGVATLAGPGASSIDSALRLRLDHTVLLGGDVRLTARPIRAGTE
jgi:diaminohydroxyphosphoribosylaminopyrimidine deaminase/5-amino-6-(5-phosphoribosylamino)uracil reductase